MNKYLSRAIDYLAYEDADVINALASGVWQISLQAVAHTFDIDPYELLAKVWDRRFAKRGIKHRITEEGVFRIRFRHVRGESHVDRITGPQYNQSFRSLGLFDSLAEAEEFVGSYTH